MSLRYGTGFSHFFLFLRFKIVFSANGDANDENASFAFISNGKLIVNGTGTLQIMDVLGHQLMQMDLSTPHSGLMNRNSVLSFALKRRYDMRCYMHSFSRG